MPSILSTALYGLASSLLLAGASAAAIDLNNLSEHALAARATCQTVTVVSGDSCGSLASKCGISGAQFTQYNPASNLCSTLQVGQLVCCSAGTLPSNTPQPSANGTCATYAVQAGDYCSLIASNNHITVAQLQSYNSQTWGWNGCNDLQLGQILCLSTGYAPMPAPLNGAVCGPQVPGTATPPVGTDLSTLNQCPLNACCDVWGQCGTTPAFCTNTSTGAPGTAASGTNGCISNCGTQMIYSAVPQQYRKVGFFQGYNLERSCLYETASQINAAQYTHLIFAFATLTPGFIPQFTDEKTKFEFEQFLQIKGPKKILSIGGYDFSTNPNTYNIFRSGVTAANRVAMANYIAFWVIAYGLDGVNIDWEYPGDTPGIPPASPDDGGNYLSFLFLLRGALGWNAEISIAAPPTYHYLKNFPIQLISYICDYIIFMTYDYHLQGDAGSQYSQDGCPTGNCLRSDVNITETYNSLSMITKAGVPSNKVVVGVTSYGRSFEMAQPGCAGPNCQFLGNSSYSPAEPGRCTQTAGILANAEINEILANSSRVNQNYYDSASGTNILVYDNNQWVGYMSDSTKQARSNIYQFLHFGGTSDWALDYQTFNPPPAGSSSWAAYIAAA